MTAHWTEMVAVELKIDGWFLPLKETKQPPINGTRTPWRCLLTSFRSVSGSSVKNAGRGNDQTQSLAGCVGKGTFQRPTLWVIREQLGLAHWVDSGCSRRN